MDISPYAFIIFSGIAVGSAISVVTLKNPVANALSLIVVFFSFAAIYGLMGAHLVAVLQILIYAGAVMVLFLFVIMLLKADAPSLDIRRTPLVFKVVAPLMALALLAGFFQLFSQSTFSAKKGAFSADAIEALGGNTQVMAELLFSEYILPFEATSVLLLTAIVAVVAIAMRKKAAQ